MRKGIILFFCIFCVMTIFMMLITNALAVGININSSSSIVSSSAVVSSSSSNGSSSVPSSSRSSFPGSSSSSSSSSLNYGDYNYILIDNDVNVCITKYTGTEISVAIPDIIVGKSVTSIGIGAFNGKSNITTITIPNSVTSIGEYAFQSCSSLTAITLPNGITSISKSLFILCNNLKTITLPNGITSIGPFAFASSGLTTISIPSSVTSIGEYAFSDCSNLKTLKLPIGLTSIGNLAFYNCGFASITIPKSVITIGNVAFYGCPVGFKIYGANNSSAQAYAIANNIPFEGISPPVITIGSYPKNQVVGKLIVYAFTNGGTLNETSHIFTKNGSFEFVAQDDAGNITKKVVIIDNIGKNCDINDDGDINVLDLILIKKSIVNQMIFGEQQKILADINNDGRINIMDAFMLKKIILLS